MLRSQQGMILMIALIFLLLSSLMLSSLLWQSQLAVAASAAGQQQFILMNDALAQQRLVLHKQEQTSGTWSLLVPCPASEDLPQDQVCQLGQLLTEVKHDEQQRAAYRSLLWRQQADQPWQALMILTDEQE